MSYETIRVERDGPLLTITLNRPERLNAMPPAMADELGQAFYDLGDARAVLITGEGKGGVAGFAKGGAFVTMTADGTGTKLTYEVEASVGGKIAQLGSRIIDGFAKNLAEEFFNRFQSAVEGPDQEAPAEAEDASTEGAQDTPKKGWFRRLIG